MPSQHSLQLAIKYASRLRQLSLAERLSEMARNKAAEEAAARLQETEDEEDFRTTLDAR